jgi:hypothetical protein
MNTLITRLDVPYEGAAARQHASHAGERAAVW